MASPVKITTAQNRYALCGSGEPLLDRDRNGTLWLSVLDGSDDVRPWYSKDQGITWSFAGSDSEVDDIHVRDPQAFVIDAEGYAHSVARKSNTTLRYSRGTPHRNGRAWEWKTKDFAPSTEALAPDSGLSMVSFKVGSGWKTWILSGTTLRDQAGNYTNTLRLTRIDISSSGGISIGNTQTLRTDTGGSYPHGSLSFQHTGDGKTSTATPHVYVVSAVNTPDISQQTQDPLQLVKLTYESGNWTIGAAVTLDAAVDTTGRTLRSGFDGLRVAVAYGTRNRTTGISSAQVRVVDWTESSGVVTRHDPPAYGGGYPLGTTVAIDPVSDDLFVVAYGETNDDPVWTRYNRAGDQWGAWGSVAPMSANGKAGRVSMKSYVSSSAIDLVYLTGTLTPYTVYYVKLTSINKAPTSPSLLTPPSSSVVDLATNGAVFSWGFNDPDPGDQQGAWQMRRKTTGAYEYLNNASDTWQATPVWNTGSATSRSFGAGRWTNGLTYQWSVNVQDAGGLASGFAPDSTVVASVAPSVVVTSPFAAYSEDSSPVVTWDYFSAGNPQRTYQIRLFDLPTYTAPGFDPAASGAVWDSAEVASVQARYARIGVSLLNGGTYRAFMRVSDSLGIYSAWSYGEFVLILTPAPAPALEVVEEVNYATGLKRARLTLQGSTNMLTASQAYDHTNTPTDWVVDLNATLAANTSGTGSATVAGRAVQMTASGGGDMRVLTSNGIAPVDTTGAPAVTPRDFAAQALQTYTAVASFTSAGAPRLCRTTLQFYGPTDILLSTVRGNAVADLFGFPTQVSVSAAAPLGANRVRLVLEVLGANAGDVHYVDRIDLHPGDVVDYSPGGLEPAQTFTVTRTAPGSAPVVVRSVNALLPDDNQHLIGYDREMPFGVDVSYTAQAVTILTSGQGLASDPSPAAVVNLTSEVWGIRDPLDDAVEARGLVYEHETDTTEQMTVYRPAGRRLPLVETEGIQGEDGSKLTIMVDGVAERQNLKAILFLSSAVLLQTPAGDSWFVRFLDRKKVATTALGQSWECTYVEVASP